MRSVRSGLRAKMGCNVCQYPLQADIIRLLGIVHTYLLFIFPNDSFQNLPVFYLIYGFNEHAININESTSKLHNIYTFENIKLFHSFKAALTTGKESML